MFAAPMKLAARQTRGNIDVLGHTQHLHLSSVKVQMSTGREWDSCYYCKDDQAIIKTNGFFGMPTPYPDHSCKDGQHSEDDNVYKDLVVMILTSKSSELCWGVFCRQRVLHDSIYSFRAAETQEVGIIIE